MSFSRGQTHSLVMLAVIVTTVMLAVSDNVVGAFGVFGALAMIRFRTPIKDARDTSFLFLAVAVGVAVGMRNIPLAVVGTSFALLVALYLTAVRFGAPRRHDGMLRLQLAHEAGDEAVLGDVLREHCSSFSLLHTRDSEAGADKEVAYRLTLHDPEEGTALLEDVRDVPGIGAVSLLMQNHDEEP